MLCKKSCPAEAINGEAKKVHEIDQSLCIKCGACMEACPEKFSAIGKKTGIFEFKPEEQKILNFKFHSRRD